MKDLSPSLELASNMTHERYQLALQLHVSLMDFVTQEDIDGIKITPTIMLAVDVLAVKVSRRGVIFAQIMQILPKIRYLGSGNTRILCLEKVCFFARKEAVAWLPMNVPAPMDTQDLLAIFLFVDIYRRLIPRVRATCRLVSMEAYALQEMTAIASKRNH